MHMPTIDISYLNGILASQQQLLLMENFKQGDRVVCTMPFAINHSDKTIPNEYKYITLPEQGKEYTVREVIKDQLGDEALRLEEIINKTIYHNKGGWQEPCFNPAKFELKK